MWSYKGASGFRKQSSMHYMQVSSQFRVPVALDPESLRYRLDTMQSGSYRRPQQAGEEENRSLCRPNGSQSLYVLSYPGSSTSSQ
jgi:hypothetical protein